MSAGATSLTFAHPLPTTAGASSASCIRPPGTVLLRWRTSASPSALSPAFRVRTSVRVDRSFYDLIGVPASGSFVEIKKAYKQLARRYHPDLSPPDRVEEYTQRFIEVQEAYETLSDPGRRSLYDRDLARREKALAFSTRRRRFDELQKEMENRSHWKNHWQNQLAELARKRMNDSKDNSSWRARMRLQRAESF